MTRDEVVDMLRTHKATLAQCFGVIELALFGSFARDQASDKSDVDILVRFDPTVNWERYFGAQFYLEDGLGGRSVDLVIANDLRPEVRPYVEREILNV